MKKALMYLLLALGIFFAVVLIGGALVGFISGFIDGFNDQQAGTTSSSDIMNCVLAACFVLVGVILHIVFLSLGYSSYTLGRIPKGGLWKVVLPMMFVMGGVALVYIYFYNPMTDSDVTLFAEPDEKAPSIYLWAHEHFLYAIPLFAFVEATLDMIFFGGILREILEWKHRPQLVIGVMALIAGLFYVLFGDSPYVVILSMIVFLIQSWTYECTRSIIPVIVGDILFWCIVILLMGNTFSWWYLLPIAVIVIPACYYLFKVMDPYKPID
jgi:hypothetical protein